MGSVSTTETARVVFDHEHVPFLKFEIADDETDSSPASCGSSFTRLSLSNAPVVGKGAFGSVRLVPWIAWPIAVKTLTSHSSSSSSPSSTMRSTKSNSVSHSSATDRMLETFVAEITAIARVSHPDCVRFLGASINPQRLAVVTEFCAGRDLSRRVAILSAAGAPPTGPGVPAGFTTRLEALETLLGIARGMAYLHARGMVHRDLKPENVLLDVAFRIRIADFGLSVESISSKRVVVCGTRAYMAPEVVRGQENDFPADVWAFGTLAWELLCSAKASPNRSDPYIPPGSFEMSLPWPEPLTAILTKCFDRSPLLRPTFVDILPEIQAACTLIRWQQACDAMDFVAISKLWATTLSPSAPSEFYPTYTAPSLIMRRSPLHVCVAYDVPSLVAQALDAGCDPNGMDLDGNTPLSLATQSSDKVRDLLVSRGSKPFFQGPINGGTLVAEISGASLVVDKELILVITENTSSDVNGAKVTISSPPVLQTEPGFSGRDQAQPLCFEFEASTEDEALGWANTVSSVANELGSLKDETMSLSPLVSPAPDAVWYSPSPNPFESNTRSSGQRSSSSQSSRPPTPRDSHNDGTTSASRSTTDSSSEQSDHGSLSDEATIAVRPPLVLESPPVSDDPLSRSISGGLASPIHQSLPPQRSSGSGTSTRASQPLHYHSLRKSVRSKSQQDGAAARFGMRGLAKNAEQTFLIATEIPFVMAEDNVELDEKTRRDSDDGVVARIDGSYLWIDTDVVEIPLASSKRMGRVMRHLHRLCGVVHPNLHPFIGVVPKEKSILLVSPRVTGWPLQNVISSADLLATPRRGYMMQMVLAAAAQVAMALDALHGAEISHGNLHPGSIYLSDSSVVQLVEFGIPSLVQVCAPSLMSNVEVDELFAAPEVYDNSVPPGFLLASDVWSFATVLLVALSAEVGQFKAPFQGDRETAAPGTLPGTIPTNTPPELSALMMAVFTAPPPEERPSISEFCNVLQPIVLSRSVYIDTSISSVYEYRYVQSLIGAVAGVAGIPHRASPILDEMMEYAGPLCQPGGVEVGTQAAHVALRVVRNAHLQNHWETVRKGLLFVGDLAARSEDIGKVRVMLCGSVVVRCCLGLVSSSVPRDVLKLVLILLLEVISSAAGSDTANNDPFLSSISDLLNEEDVMQDEELCGMLASLVAWAALEAEVKVRLADVGAIETLIRAAQYWTAQDRFDRVVIQHLHRALGNLAVDPDNARRIMAFENNAIFALLQTRFLSPQPARASDLETTHAFTNSSHVASLWVVRTLVMVDQGVNWILAHPEFVTSILTFLKGPALRCYRAPFLLAEIIIFGPAMARLDQDQRAAIVAYFGSAKIIFRKRLRVLKIVDRALSILCDQEPL